LQDLLLEIPWIWPGTREQAETLVHAFETDAPSDDDRKRFVEIVQQGARLAWRDLTACLHLPRTASEARA